ncbi:MAG: PQQ-dependent sugar dehydrogenase [Patescibacteria group bacterium]|mgnify:CR=1 FL=1
MKSKLIILAIVAVLVGGYFVWNKYQPTPVPAPSSDETVTGMQIPPGFQLDILAKGLSGARVIVQDQFGNFWVSRPSKGVVTTLEMEDGKVRRQVDVFKNMSQPHGLALDPQHPLNLYIAETDKISRVPLYSDGEIEKIADLPGGGGHSTRTIEFGPDNRLYVSIGSSCNVCHEENQQRAKIFSMNPDGSDLKEFARGLRNTVFFTWSYVDGKMWGTEMGRDLLGDDLPPDEINILTEGRNYGWPNCYGKNIHDDAFDKNTYIRNPCMEPFEAASHIDLQAHSAPLGLVFVPEEGWPEEYWYDLLVSYHGSWNRSEPTGYKIVRLKLDSKGKYSGVEDFITGWIKDGAVSGRPVGLLIQPGGTMYITDDHAGVVYKLSRK